MLIFKAYHTQNAYLIQESPFLNRICLLVFFLHIVCMYITYDYFTKFSL